MKWSIALGLLVLAFLVPAAAQDGDGPILAREPALSAEEIVFVYAGDLWSVPRQGGEARRLTAGVGVETGPSFSSDGRWISFTGQYDGNTDVFVVPAEGGVPERLTWHPAPDIALGWTPGSDRVLFSSPRNSYSRFNELYLAGLDGGLPEKLPLPMGWEASFSPDGQRIAYVPASRAFSVWKRYRGGRTTPIWLATLSDSQIEKLPRDNSNDFDPMWVGDEIYFLSDRNGAVTLFSYDVKTKAVDQVVENRGLDFKSASAGPGGIVIEQFGGILLYDIASQRVSPVDIDVAGDLPELRPKFVEVGTRLTSAHISPTGARALFQARGEIITVPAEKGDARNLTETVDTMERDPAWSPDGRWIAYFSDESGEYELHVRSSLGDDQPRKISLENDPTFYFAPRWSPDSQKLAYLDAHLNTWYVDIDDAQPVKVDQDRFWGSPTQRIPVWSPDSRWLAYNKRLPNYLSAIFLYSVPDGTSTQLTDGLSDARHPVFDADGKYLYFTASTNVGPSLEADIRSFSQPVARSVYLVVLSDDEPSPFAPESDEEPVPDDRDDEDDAEPAESDPDASDEPAQADDQEGGSPDDATTDESDEVTVDIDWERIDQRILAMPLPPRRYVGLQAGKAGTLLALEGPMPAPGVPPGLTVHRHDLGARKSDVVTSGVSFFEVSANGEKMLTARENRWTIASLRPMSSGAGNGSGGPRPPAPPGADNAGDVLRTDDIVVRSDPRAEWTQMYHDAWRIQREFFYDPSLHGLNLQAAIDTYEPYLGAVKSRGDLNYLFAEMMGQLTVGHLGVGGGDRPETETVRGGLLGNDYAIDNGRYRFARIFNGENWNPDLEAPLTQPGVNVQEGEYLLAVNGRNLVASDNVYSFFEGLSGKNVVLRVGPTADGADARDVTVVPVPNEVRLRNRAWIEDNRRAVDDATDGRVAYVYMPDTGFGGFTSFTRYFYAQVGKEAVIIDERFNGGGALATDIIQQLDRELLSLVSTRDGQDEVQPQGAIFGPKVMIINEFAGSGGDAMPNYFRRAGVGQLVGKRTWGGLVGRAGAPALLDGGFVTAPSSAVWGPAGEWDAENVGIPPDIEVEHDPALVRQGRDPQLEKAIEVVMEELARHPAPTPTRPAYPDYHRSEDRFPR